jgi:hypothetical protein
MKNVLVLFRAEPVLCDDFRSDGGGFEDVHGRALSPVCERRLGCDERV